MKKLKGHVRSAPIPWRHLSWIVSLSISPLSFADDFVLFPISPGSPTTEISRESFVEFRSITGHGNNPRQATWGSVGRDGQGLPLKRMVPVLRPDVLQRNDEGLSSPREISQTVCEQGQALIPNRRGVSDLFWQWGQFLDHDISLTPTNQPAEPWSIPVPFGDPFFDPRRLGNQTISFNRSAHVLIAGQREAINQNTSFIDASQVYGSTEERARALRALDGTGRLKTSHGELLPFNLDGLPNTGGSQRRDLFLAGDERPNEQIGLLALHTIFMREHNWIATRLRQQQPTLNDEEIYQRARAIVGAQIQKITFESFLPLLLGRPLSAYRGYQSQVDPTVSQEFTTAAFRVGHTMLSPTILLRDQNGRPFQQGQVALRDAFSQPAVFQNIGVEAILRGLASQQAQEVDPLIIDDVRNFLFGQPGQGGFDLVSLNIQRGRDHNIPGYNQVRRTLNLVPARRFLKRHAQDDGITSNPEFARRLELAYGSPDRVDLWVGGLSEDHRPGAMVGELFARIIEDQFVRLRDGDRFWYQLHLGSGFWGDFLERESSLAQIIRRNSRIGQELADEPMLVQNSSQPPTNPPTAPQSFVEYCENAQTSADIRRTIGALLKQTQSRNCRQAQQELQQLEVLDLSGMQISRLEPLASFSQLELLILNDNQIQDLRALSNLRQLQELELNQNRIRNLQPLSGMSLLVHLEINSNEIEDLRPLSGMRKLVALRAANNQVRDLSPLRQVQSLIFLDLSRNPLGQSISKNQRNCPVGSAVSPAVDRFCRI
ncbi:MAG: peroxidase family protein [Oligoflexus sp.]